MCEKLTHLVLEMLWRVLSVSVEVKNREETQECFPLHLGHDFSVYAS